MKTIKIELTQEQADHLTKLLGVTLCDGKIFAKHKEREREVLNEIYESISDEIYAINNSEQA